MKSEFKESFQKASTTEICCFKCRKRSGIQVECKNQQAKRAYFYIIPANCKNTLTLIFALHPKQPFPERFKES